METRVELNYLRLAPRKVRMVARLLKGKSYQEAERELLFAPQRAARALLKLLRAAKANLAGKSADGGTLRVTEIRVDVGPSFKRWVPRAMGRASPLTKRTSHVTLVLSSPAASLTSVSAPASETPTEPPESREHRMARPKRVSRKGSRQEVPTRFTELSRRIFRRKAV